jgi:hypothetical protein
MCSPGPDLHQIIHADSVHRFSEAACHPGRDHRATLTAQVYPGADHRVQAGGGTGLAPGYLSMLTQWIKDRSQV